MYTQVIERLGNSDLNEILFSVDARTLTLNFTFAGFAGGEGHDVVVRLHGITNVQINRAQDDHPCFFVGEAHLESLPDNHESPEDTLYRFWLDGELTLDVTCGFVQVFEQAPIGATLQRELSAIK